MTVNSALTTILRSGNPCYRITPLSLFTADPTYHVRVVNGQGAKKSKAGSRYNYPGVRTVYLAEELETCFAEKMFYFQREILRGIYEHLKLRRADIESSGYQGLKALSSRAERSGSIVALFEDQSSNVQSIVPYRVDFRLITEGGAPFINHAGDILDFTTGEVKIVNSTMPAGAAGGNYQYWQRISFNH